MIRKDSNCESASDSYPPVSPIRSEWSSDHLQILLFKRKFKNIYFKKCILGPSTWGCSLMGILSGSVGFFGGCNYQNIYLYGKTIKVLNEGIPMESPLTQGPLKIQECLLKGYFMIHTSGKIIYHRIGNRVVPD